MATAVTVANLERTFGTGENKVRALRGVDLHIDTGQFVALKGRSGSGKTTLLNCLGGLDEPTSGTIEIYGRALHNLSDKERTTWRRAEVGFIFQSFGLIPTLSAFENVELMLRIAKAPRKERPARALYCLDLVGLSKWAGHRPYEMSGGQQQRVAIARAIANRPRLILADEPTGELDSDTAQDVLTLFRQIVREEEMTMLMASHDSLVDEYVDQVLHLQDGVIKEIVRSA
ncbi:MAG: ABC transporter ATP-binding protein [Anaerolineae bacterium]|nr:ABC transporter ATP-binding protein [Anaerolineae bacterium]